MLTNDIPVAGSVLIQGGTRVLAKPSGTGIRRQRQLAPHNVLRQRVYSGDCAEFNANRIRDSFRVQMALVAMFGGGVLVVKVDRLAGQFAKPRSSGTEIVDGVELPSYRRVLLEIQILR
ncbi:g8609 [Coccomyxa elongata]